MKILMINQDWFAPEFREAGHEVMSCGYAQHLDIQLVGGLPHINEIVRSLPGGFYPDAIVFHDNSSPVSIIGFETCDIPVLFYSVDAHHHYALHSYLAHLFDYTMVAQKDYIGHFEALGREVEWMPLWASRVVEASSEKSHKAVFVGNLNPALNPQRVAFFEALKKKTDVFCTVGEWWKIFPNSEIVINQTVKGDLNFRVFEAMVCGSLLLTEKSPNGLFELFSDGQHLVSYNKNDVDEAASLIDYYISNQARCREIAAAGRAEIVAKHMPAHRAQRMLEVLSKLKKTTSPMRKTAAFRNFAQTATLLERNNNTGMSLRMMMLAMKAMEDALKDGEVMTFDAACYLVAVASMYDSAVGSHDGQDLLRRVYEAHTTLPVLALARIRMLLNEGRIEEATSIARSISNEEPKAVFEGSEKLTQEILSRLLL